MSSTRNGLDPQQRKGTGRRERDHVRALPRQQYDGVAEER